MPPERAGMMRSRLVRRGASRLGRRSWAAWCRSLVLPLLLLFAQQGALLHELSHYAGSDPQGAAHKQSPRGEACELCLAFAQVDAAVAPHDAVAPLLGDLSFERATAPRLVARAADLPSLRNRGPPRFL